MHQSRRSAAAVASVTLACLLAAPAHAAKGGNPDIGGATCQGQGATIVGTEGDDRGSKRIDGTPGNDVIIARQGNDVVFAGAGDDIVCLRSGDDRAGGGEGNDLIRGGGGSDTYGGGPGKDNLRGGAANDNLFGEKGKDKLDGGAAQDACDGGPGKDKLRRCESKDADAGANQAPDAVDDLGGTNEDTPIALTNLLKNDADDDLDPLSVASIDGTATKGKVTLAGDTVTYDPGSAFQSLGGGEGGTDSFTYTASDGKGGTDPATVHLVINGVEDPASAANDAATVAEDSSATAINVLTNDSDVDDVELVGSTTQPANGNVAITGGGSGLTYTPNANYCNNPSGTPDTFTYTLQGGPTATVSVTVTCIDDAPGASDDSFSAVGNTGLFVGTSRPPGEAGKEITGSLLANDSDPDTGTLFVAPVTGSATLLGGRIDINADGTFVYQPGAGADSGTDIALYRVCDTSPCSLASPRSDVAVLEIPLSDQVWWVDNTAAAGGDGTSDGPFDTTAEAEAASGNGDTTYVFSGSGSTGYDTGYTMDPSEEIYGQPHSLAVGGFVLIQPPSISPPRLTSASEGVITLDDGNTVRMLGIDPQGTHAGVVGGPGDDVGVLNSLDVQGAAGHTGPGIELDSTSGPFDVTGTLINEQFGGTALRLNANSGVVQIVNSAMTTETGRALDATSTNLGNSFVSLIESRNATNGAVRMKDTTGTTDFTTLIATGAIGATPAIDLDNPGLVTVQANAVNDVTSNGGPAISIKGPASGSALAFDVVSSSTSATDGIDLDLTGSSATFSANAGTITQAAGLAFDLVGGTGDVTYGGNIGNGPGNSLEISGRTGGTATLSGSIADFGDVGGLIHVFDNTGGSTVLSGPSKAIDVGAGDALVFENSNGHTLNVTGGGLFLTATNGGKALDVTNSGTFTLEGPDNVVNPILTTAVRIEDTDIGPGGVTLESVGTVAAANGIVLDSTGSAGDFVVTGTPDPMNPTACTVNNLCTGGQLHDVTNAAVSLTDVGGGVHLNEMRIQVGDSDGISGSNVTDFSLAHSRVTNNGDIAGENGIEFTNLTGTATFTDSTITGNADRNISLVNSGTGILNASARKITVGSNSATIGGDGIHVENSGSSQTGLFILDSDFADNRDDHIEVTTTGAANTAKQRVRFAVNTYTTSAARRAGNTGGAINLTPGGSATLDASLSGEDIDFTKASAVRLDPQGTALSPQPVKARFHALTSLIGNSVDSSSGSATGAGFEIRAEGGATVDSYIGNSGVWGYATRGVLMTSTDPGSSLEALMRETGVSLPLPSADYGVLFRSGTPAGAETASNCLSLGGTDVTGDFVPNNAAASGSAGDFRVEQNAATTLRLRGYAGGAGDTAAIENHIESFNNGNASAAVSGGGGGVVGTNTAACSPPETPLLPGP